MRFLCAAYGTRIGISFSKRIGAGFFGGEGFILQRLQGDGLAFIHAGGTVIRKELNNETLRLDTGCLVAFTPGIDYDIQLAGGLRSMLFGGEGLLLTTLKGTGSVWIRACRSRGWPNGSTRQPTRLAAKPVPAANEPPASPSNLPQWRSLP